MQSGPSTQGQTVRRRLKLSKARDRNRPDAAKCLQSARHASKVRERVGALAAGVSAEAPPFELDVECIAAWHWPSTTKGCP
eukprot:2042592-Alexandrium_andersonii.AAC.1